MQVFKFLMKETINYFVLYLEIIAGSILLIIAIFGLMEYFNKKKKRRGKMGKVWKGVFMVILAFFITLALKGMACGLLSCFF